MNKMSTLYQQLKPKMSLPNNVQQMAQTFKAMQNPNAMAQQMLNQNPQLQALIKASNGNYEMAFRNLAQHMNVDPDEIMNMLK